MERTKMEINKLAEFNGNKSSIYALEGLIENRYFFSGSADGMVVQWDMEQPTQGKLLAKMPNSVYSLHHHVESGYLIVGHNRQGIHVFDWQNRAEVGSLNFTKSALYDLCSFKNLLFAGTEEGELYVVDIKHLKVVQSFKLCEERIRSIRVDALQNKLLVGASNGKLYVFDLKTLKMLEEIQAHETSLFSIDFCGSIITTVGKDAKLKFWDDIAYALQETVIGHIYAINTIKYNAEGSYFITGSMDKTVKIWDAKTNKLLKVIDFARHQGHVSSVNDVFWCSDRTFISAGDDKKIILWQFDGK